MGPPLHGFAIDIIRTARSEKTASAVISFDSPYILDFFKDADVLVAAYDRMDAIQNSAAEMLALGPRVR